MIPLPDLAVCPGMSKGLGCSGDFAWDWGPTALLHEYVEPGAVFPLRVLDAYPVLRHPGPLNTPVCGLHQSDKIFTLDVYVHL